MELLEHGSRPYLAPPAGLDKRERAARGSLRLQIARLERELAASVVTAYKMGVVDSLRPAGSRREARMLDLGELERVRDELVDRLHAARTAIARAGEIQAANRLHLEKMLLEPGRYRFARISRSDVGEPGCGAWEVRPRLGIIGMLMGWWRVTLSSGCPLP
ncbi:MAG: hypothetical protein M3076_18925 [Actinomycetota bacterium]|nr:hypothetical protein [Actinomycetota bacterium]